jgi:hypothetical protein
MDGGRNAQRLGGLSSFFAAFLLSSGQDSLTVRVNVNQTPWV